MNWKCRLLMMLAISANCAATNSDASRQHIREKKHVSDGDQVHVLPVDDVRPKRSGNNGDGEGVEKDSQTALTEGEGEAATGGGDGMAGGEGGNAVAGGNETTAGGGYGMAAGEGPTAPSGEGPTAPSGEGPTAPSGEGPTAPSGEGPTAPSGEGPTAPSGEGPAAVGDGEKPAQPAAGGDGGGPANSGDGNEPQARQIPVAPLQSHGYVDFDGKKCRFGKDKESAKASSPINGKVIVNQHPGRAAFPKCMADFDKIAEKKMCGTDYYELFAYCLKANFFGQQGVEHVRGSKFMERPQKPPTSIKDHQANYMQDMALVIIEGCLQCMGGNNDAKQKAKIQLVQHHPVGPIRQVCGLEDEKASGEIEVSLSDSSFIISAILLERFCPSRPNANDSNIMLAPLRYAHNISISVTHTCDDSKKETVEIFRLSKLIELAKLQDHVFELREVSITLNDKGPIREPSNGESPSQNQSLPSVPVGGGVIDWDWERKEMGMGYEYYVGAQTKSSAQNTNRAQTADGKLNQMELDREARRNEFSALVGDMIGAGDDDM